MTEALKPDKSNWYRSFSIPKRSGGFRKIEAPVDSLKAIQRNILDDILMHRYGVAKRSFGGVRKRNIAMAAEEHVAYRFKLKMDISDFYPSITAKMVKEALQREIQEKSWDVSAPKFTEADYTKIAYVCTNASGVLPQGAPTSAALANIVMCPIVNEFAKWATEHGAVFSMYVDDMIMSANDINLLFKARKYIAERLKSFGLKVKRAKTVIMRRKQEILGVCAEKQLNHTRLPRKKRYILRAALHNLQKSVEAGEKVDAKLLNKIHGQISFAQMVKDQWAGRFVKQFIEIKNKIGDNTK